MRTLLMLVAALAAGVCFGKTATVPGGTVQTDLEYVAGGGPARSLDLYLPDQVGQPVPVVLLIHGGAWYLGDKGQTGGFQNPLLQHGYAVASINYRLVPNAVFPKQLYDCKAAVRWLRANAGKYHLDSTHIGVWGTSAGGHLAALLGVTGDEMSFRPPSDELRSELGDVPYLRLTHGFGQLPSSRVQAVCDWAGPADLPALLKDPNLGGLVGNLLGGPKLATRDNAEKASPVAYVSKNAAPFLIMHGEKDNTVPVSQSEALAATLKKAGVDCTLLIVPGAGHGVGGSAEFAKHVLPFFDQHLKAK